MTEQLVGQIYRRKSVHRVLEHSRRLKDGVANDLDAYGVEQSLVDTADAGHLTDGKVMHKCLDHLRLEVQLKLAIWLVLNEYMRQCCHAAIGQ